MSSSNSYETIIIREYDFELIDNKYTVEYQSPHDETQMILYVSVYTDGFTKILRFSNKSRIDELRGGDDSIRDSN